MKINNVIITILDSLAITLFTSVGYFAALVFGKNFFSFANDLFGWPISEKLMYFFSGFPFRVYKICVFEDHVFFKCIWSNIGQMAIVYNIIFWFVALGASAFMFNQWRSRSTK